MTISANPSISKSTYQNIAKNQPKLTLCERVSKIFSRLYEKISSLFSRKPNQMKKLEGIEPIYDVPQNNQPIKKLTLYERVVKLFSRGPNQVELLEEKFNRENIHLRQAYQTLHHNICVNATQINKLEACVRALKDIVDTQETRINSLKETILPLEDERSDRGFSESPSIEKKPNLLSKAKSYLETKIG